MAVPAELSRLRATAQARAAEIYDPFRSKEDAIRNEEYFARINKEMRAALLEERNLNEAEVAEILAEYQASMGAELR